MLEKIAEENNTTVSEAIEIVVASSVKYNENLEDLKNDYPDIQKS